MLSAVLGVLAERYSSRGYLASGKITWDGLSEKLHTRDLQPHIRRLSLMGAVLPDRAGLTLAVPLRLQVINAAMVRHWAGRVDAIGREDFREAAEALAREEFGNLLDYVVKRGQSLGEESLQVAAGCAGVLAVRDILSTPMAFTVVAWHPGYALDKLEWLMQQEAKTYPDAAALQTSLFSYVRNRRGGPLVQLPIAMLKPGADVPFQRPASDFERAPMRVVTTGKAAPRREYVPHKCSPNCSHPTHRPDLA